MENETMQIICSILKILFYFLKYSWEVAEKSMEDRKQGMQLINFIYLNLQQMSMVTDLCQIQCVATILQGKPDAALGLFP